MSKPIYVIGHRNPDTDSICSAIGYAHLKDALGDEVMAVRAGKINPETKFVLEYFGWEAPPLIHDLHPRVRDVMAEVTTTVRPCDTLRELGQVMKTANAKSVPVIGEDGALYGIVSVGDLAKRYFDELEIQDLSQAGVTYGAILRALNGAFVTGDLQRKVNGKIRIAAARSHTMLQMIQPGDIVLVGDRDEAQIACMEKGVECLIITGNAQVSIPVLEVAETKGVVLIRAPHDTYTCARLINQSIPVQLVMQPNVLTFNPSDLMADIKETIIQTKFRSYPVVANGKLVGMISRDRLIVQQKEKVILVDHNEKTQAVEGIEEVQIVEIVDHHRLGGLETSEPIFIRHEPVGSTATIVANMHWHRGVTLPKDIAGLLLAAIISDTFLFKSPTSTTQDRDTASKLAAIAGLDIEAFGMEILKAGSDLAQSTPTDYIHRDLKEFQIGEYRVSISQISVLDPEKALEGKDEIHTYLEEMRQKEGYDIAALMITDIIKEATHLVFVGQPAGLFTRAFGQPDDSGVLYLPSVMSRKKQIVPPLVDTEREM